MSFSRRDPSEWTGQTIRTEELTEDALTVITEILRRALSGYEARSQESTG
jgi:hypothetical protein